MSGLLEARYFISQKPIHRVRQDVFAQSLTKTLTMGAEPKIGLERLTLIQMLTLNNTTENTCTILRR